MSGKFTALDAFVENGSMGVRSDEPPLLLRIEWSGEQ